MKSRDTGSEIPRQVATDEVEIRGGLEVILASKIRRDLSEVSVVATTPTPDLLAGRKPCG
jgi:hypothetical protein